MRKREGIEPRYKPEIMDADVLTNTEGNTGGAKDQGSRGSIGVRDHSTSPRQSRELGRSHKPLHHGGRAAQPANREEAQWFAGSRMPE